jgi:hypothetical protein
MLARMQLLAHTDALRRGQRIIGALLFIFLGGMTALASSQFLFWGLVQARGDVLLYVRLHSDQLTLYATLLGSLAISLAALSLSTSLQLRRKASVLLAGLPSLGLAAAGALLYA